MDDDLEKERAAVLSAIHEAFAGVTREGGVSWSETDLLDGGRGWPELLAEARKNDLDTRWEELTDDPNWDAWPGGGGFSFLDPIGFTYYLPPALIRIATASEPSGLEESMQYHLSVPKHGQGPLARDFLNEAQRKAVARFLLFMTKLTVARGDDEVSIECACEAYGNYWPTLLS